jgi:hypothetical protein
MTPVRMSHRELCATVTAVRSVVTAVANSTMPFLNVRNRTDPRPSTRLTYLQRRLINELPAI